MTILEVMPVPVDLADNILYFECSFAQHAVWTKQKISIFNKQAISRKLTGKYPYYIEQHLLTGRKYQCATLILPAIILASFAVLFPQVKTKL